MPSPSHKLEHFFAEIEHALTHALHVPPIAEALGKMGYSRPALESKRTALEHLRQLHQMHGKAAREPGPELLVHFDRFYQTLEGADRDYRPALAVARVAFKNDTETAARLKLHGERHRSLVGWLHQTKSFYHPLREDARLAGTMAAFGHAPELLQEHAARIDDIERMRLDYLNHIGMAHHTSRLRDARVLDLDEWLADFRTIARIALKSSPEHLEALGLDRPD